jgi:hypothetical protein
VTESPWDLLDKRMLGSESGIQVVTELRVPHISLVFREMWDTTNLNEKCLLGSKVRRLKAVVSHISRKTSEIWGTAGTNSKCNEIGLN